MPRPFHKIDIFLYLNTTKEHHITMIVSIPFPWISVSNSQLVLSWKKNLLDLFSLWFPLTPWRFWSACGIRTALCLFVDRCVTSGASLFQVRFRQWIVAQNKAEEKKLKNGRRRDGGFFPLTLCPNVFFLLGFLCAVHTIRDSWNRLSGASRLGCGLSRKERQHNYECFKANLWSAFFLFDRSKIFFNWYAIAPRALSWHLVEVGLLSVRLFTSLHYLKVSVRQSLTRSLDIVCLVERTPCWIAFAARTCSRVVMISRISDRQEKIPHPVPKLWWTPLSG